MKIIYFLLTLSALTSCSAVCSENQSFNTYNFYSYLQQTSSKDSQSIRQIWRNKYGKAILNRPHWELQFKKLYSQGRRPDCAPTCIAMLCEYYNIPHEPSWKIGRKIRSKGTIKTTGTTVFNIVKELKSMGLYVCIYSSNVSDLKEKIEAGTPVLVIQQYSIDKPDGHVRIVIGFNNMTETFTVIDPNYGNKKCYIKYSEFLKLWKYSNNCVILAFK